MAAANEAGALVEELRARVSALAELVGEAETMHDDGLAQGMRLSDEGKARMAAVRETADRLELLVGDEHWPLPKYREMLFPV